MTSCSKNALNATCKSRFLKRLRQHRSEAAFKCRVLALFSIAITTAPCFLSMTRVLKFLGTGVHTIQFSPDQYRDNLSSILAYYAYMILGMDYDSMVLDGGTPYYLKAQTIVANAQNAGPSGWKASQGQQNRYWLVENMLSQTFRPVRNCLVLLSPHGPRSAV